MPRSNINFFTGENTVFIERELEKWLDLFSTKYGTHNIARLGPNTQLSQIQSELTTLPFLAEKRLVVLEDFMVKARSIDVEEEVPNKEQGGIESWISDNLDNIPETTVAVFIQSSPQLTNKLYKKLKDIATVRKFENLTPGDLRTYVRSKLPNIEFSAISKLLAYKNQQLQAIDQEIFKLSLFRGDDPITEMDIETYVTSDPETSIFRLVDAIFAFNTPESLRELATLLQTDSIFSIFSGVMANLRKILFIQKFLQHGFKRQDIVEQLDIKPFLIEKAQKLGTKAQKLELIFSSLTTLDRSSKTGEMIGEGELGLELAFQKMLLSL